jgi:hypothetical protein
VIDKLRKIVVGKLGFSVQEFYSMQLCEIQDAIDGYTDVRTELFNEMMISTRLISFYSMIPHMGKKSKIKKPSDLFELEVDKIARKQRIKRKKFSEVIRNAKQSNG